MHCLSRLRPSLLHLSRSPRAVTAVHLLHRHPYSPPSPLKPPPAVLCRLYLNCRSRTLLRALLNERGQRRTASSVPNLLDIGQCIEHILKAGRSDRRLRERGVGAEPHPPIGIAHPYIFLADQPKPLHASTSSTRTTSLSISTSTPPRTPLHTTTTHSLQPSRPTRN